MKLQRHEFPLVAIVLAWATLVVLWEPSYLLLTVDDSFYYLRIAQHLAGGAGPTFDGLHLTNGFHPLWLGVLTVLACVVRETSTLMRTALVLQLGLVCFALLVLARALGGRVAKSLPMLGAIALCNFYMTKILVNGQESALQFALLCGCLILAKRRSLGLGVLLGLLIWTRLDAVVFAPMALLTWDVSPRKRARAAAIVGSMAAAWVAVSWATFGTWVPVNASVKLAELWAAWSVWRVVLCVVPVALALAYLRWAWCEPDRRRSVALVGYAAYVVAAHGGLLGRPLIAIWVLPAPLLAALLIGARVWWSSIRAPVLTTALTAFALLTALTWWHRADPRSYAPYLTARESGRWIARYTPADARIAGWDVGIIGAHAERPVLNLDGLVAGIDYAERWLWTDRVEAYLEREHIDWLTQHVDARARRNGYIRGVDVSAWTVRFAQCAPFRSVAHPTVERPLLYVVLSRHPSPGAPRWSEFRQRADCRRTR